MTYLIIGAGLTVLLLLGVLWSAVRDLKEAYENGQ
jgi:hypothetical protein